VTKNCSADRWQSAWWTEA